MVKLKYMHYSCKICRSEYREPIEYAIRYQRISFRESAKRILKQFNCSLHALELSISNHYKKHRMKELTYEQLLYLERIKRGEIDLGEVAGMIEVYFRKPDY